MKIIDTKIHITQLSELKNIFNNEEVIAIIDETVLNNYSDFFSSIKARLIIIFAELNIKQWESVIYVCNELIKLQASLNTHLIGVGGGNITDLTGFIASIYMRGIRVSFVPTTLLAMVDAAIGGKNAINIGNIKNIIGNIYLPENVYINVDFLKTMHRIDILSGFAEIIKIGLLFDKKLIEECQIYLDDKNELNSSDLQKLEPIILKSIEYKVKIINEDLNCQNVRHLLNFGHTIGHILELEYNMPHGFAVANGMIFETLLAVELTLTNAIVYREISDIISKYYIEYKDIFAIKRKIGSLINDLVYDKKNYNKKIKLPVIEKIGKSNLHIVEIETIIQQMTKY